MWFPEGYWAERQLAPGARRGESTGGGGSAGSGGGSSRLWKWKSRSRGKWESEADLPEEQRHPSPKTLMSAAYRSEEAHVLSLQHPTTRKLEALPAAATAVGSPPIGKPSRLGRWSPKPPKVEEDDRSVDAQPRVNLYRKAKRGVEAAIRHKHKEASTLCSVFW